MLATGPDDFNPVDSIVVSQSEDQLLLIGTAKSVASSQISALGSAPARHQDFGSNGVSISG